jgi:hypothetical protein
MVALLTSSPLLRRVLGQAVLSRLGAVSRPTL